MKGSVKFIATAIAICLTIGVLMVGIFAATGGSMEVQSLIGWQSIGVEMDINGRVSGNKSSDNIASTYSDSLTIQHDNKVSAWQIGSINFDIKDDLAQNKRYSEPVVIRFGVTNTSTNNVNIYYYFSSAPTIIPNVKYEYQLAYGVLSSGETWQTDFFSGSYSGNMSVSGTSDKYYSLHKDTEYNFVAPGESVVFEMRFTVINFTQSISTSSNPLEANLVFQNSPREGGTMYNPYIIANAEDFNMYASNGGFANSNNYFLQTSNISFNSTQTAQAVSAPKVNAVSEDSALVVTDFLAHYDGGNKQIDLSGTNSPLFNAVGSDSNSTASLENLNIYNSNSTASAGVVKNLYGRLNNISFDGSITWSSGGYIGGIAEIIYNGCSITGCKNLANISATNSTSDVLVGGIFAKTMAIADTITIKNCANEGDLTTYWGHIGGMGGEVYYDYNESGPNSINITFINCYNMGQISIANGSYGIYGAGGMLGLSWCCSFTNCFNTATISIPSGYMRGGFVGVDDTMMSTATTCYDIGENSGLGLGGTVTNCYWLGGSGTGSKTLTQLQNRNTYSGFTFDASNWVWANAIIKINGKEKAMQLPRLAFEELEYALDRSSLYALNGTTSGEYTYYGAYPQTYVGDTLNTTLKSALEAGTLEATGYSYTTDSAGGATAEPNTVTLNEYFYQDNYYACLEQGNPYESGYTFSTGETIVSGEKYFFKVEPLKWTNHNGTYLCNSVVGSMRYASEGTTSWENSDARTWLNEVFYEESGLNLFKKTKSVVDNNRIVGPSISNDGTPTEEFVWIPSTYEIEDWFPSTTTRTVIFSDMAGATYCALSNDLSRYWSRSIAPSDNAYRIDFNGGIASAVISANIYGIRPCFILDEGSGTGTGTAAAVPQIYIDGVEQEDVAIAGATTVGDYVQALDGKNYPGYFFDEDLTQYVEEKDYATPITAETKLYTKRATLDYLTFTSNGDGTCIVEAKWPTTVNSSNNSNSNNQNIHVSTVLDGPFAETNTLVVGNVIIPRISQSGDLVTELSSGAFCMCVDMTGIVLPEGITSIPTRAFMGCERLVYATIPKGIESIGDQAFKACSALTKINIYDGVTIIGSMAFQGCSSLKNIYIPSSVVTINSANSSQSLFSGSADSFEIYCGATSQPSGWGSFWNYYSQSSVIPVTWGVTREQYESQYA